MDSPIGLLKYKRRTLVAKPKKDGKSIFKFGTQQEAIADPAIKSMPGRQNKHHGRQPGSYKRKRDIVRKSRRANRGS